MQKSYPEVSIREEGLRDGLQIESADIAVGDRIRLLDALSSAGLKNIVIGSFVSPRYTPQMACTDEVAAGFTPVTGVRYTALIPNEKGRERARQFANKIAMQHHTSAAQTGLHMCDIFPRRNWNRSQADEIAGWPDIIRRAQAAGIQEATISAHACWGSNFSGPVKLADLMTMLGRQHDMWTAAGINVTACRLADPMSWVMPHQVEETLTAIRTRWPNIRRWELHVHNGRGVAVASIYAALRVLDDKDSLLLDTAIGGIGGCPYCGNGQATGMAATEDVVNLLEEMGIPTGIDVDKLVEAAVLVQEMLGRPLTGQLGKVGPRPRGDRLYDPNMPFIETFAEAQHFRLGPSVYEGRPVPWKKPISSAH